MQVLCANLGVSSHKLKAEFGDIDVLQAKWLKALENETSHVKKLLIQAMRC